MTALGTTLTAEDLPDSLQPLYDAICNVVPLGFGEHGNDQSAPVSEWNALASRYDAILSKHPKITPRKMRKPVMQLGSLGGGNHFIEVCLDQTDHIWLMLHSGSRGIGNIIGQYFIARAKEEMRDYYIRLADQDLAYLVEGRGAFGDYIEAMTWAQDYARVNREVMVHRIMQVMRAYLPAFRTVAEAVDCHHNYTVRENHYGKNVWLTRKGAIRAREGDLGIIPGSMGDRSYIVRGKGSAEAFNSCSHGAGRVMSRTQARKTFTTDDLEARMSGIVGRRDVGVLDEHPDSYKRIDEVMAHQGDLVDVVHELRQVLNVKG